MTRSIIHSWFQCTFIPFWVMDTQLRDFSHAMVTLFAYPCLFATCFSANIAWAFFSAWLPCLLLWPPDVRSSSTDVHTPGLCGSHLPFAAETVLFVSLLSFRRSPVEDITGIGQVICWLVRFRNNVDKATFFCRIFLGHYWIGSVKMQENFCLSWTFLVLCFLFYFFVGFE